MPKPILKIPFDKDGHQLPYGLRAVELRDNYEFEDTLEYVNYSKGRSSIGFEFKRTDGTMVSMFVTDMNKILPLMKNGQITGRFTFSKRGENFGCKRIDGGIFDELSKVSVITDTDRIDHLERRSSVNFDSENCIVNFDVPDSCTGGLLREVIDQAIVEYSNG